MTAADAPEGLPLTVMIVEDEFLLAMDVEVMLSRHGYRVVGPATTVEQALGLMQRETPDVVVLDVSLNGQWATPVADALRQSAVPFILMSAYGATELESSGLLDGTQNIGKPVVERRLVKALADVVGTTGSDRAAPRATD